MSENKTEHADLSALRINRENPNSTKKRIIPKILTMGIPVILLLAVIFYLFSSNSNAIQTVDVVRVAYTNANSGATILTANGYVVAQREAAVASKGTGRLEYLGVEEGDRVKLNQIIARLDHSDMDAALQQARANAEMAKASMAESEANLQIAQLTFNRQKSLFHQHLISKSDYDIAEANYKSALAVLEAAKALLKLRQAAVTSAEVDVENTNIRAPFEGTVLTKNADVGEMVAPFAASANSRGAVVTIADMTSLEVEADVSESNIHRIQAGQHCEILLDAFPNQPYPGFVHKIVPTADRAKATVLTKIRFTKLDERVLPEMSAKVNFLAQNAPAENETTVRLTIPESAVRNTNKRDVVFVLQDNKVTERQIVPGRRSSGNIEIISGLSAGDSVVLNPRPDLKSGDEVRTK